MTEYAIAYVLNNALRLYLMIRREPADEAGGLTKILQHGTICRSEGISFRIIFSVTPQLERTVMPGKDGKLSNDEIEQVTEWMNEHWNQGCRCENKRLGLEHFLHRIEVFTPDSTQFGGNHFAYVVFTCPDCGNTQFFNAKIMGLID